MRRASIEVSRLAATFVSAVLAEYWAKPLPARPSARYAIAATTAKRTKMNANPEVIFRPIVNVGNFTGKEVRVERELFFDVETKRDRDLHLHRIAVFFGWLEFPVFHR